MIKAGTAPAWFVSKAGLVSCPCPVQNLSYLHAHPLPVPSAVRLGVRDLLEPGGGPGDLPGGGAGDPSGEGGRLDRARLPVPRGGAPHLGRPPDAALLAIRRVVARAGWRDGSARRSS